MTYDSKPDPDENPRMHMSEGGIARALFPGSAIAPLPRRPEPSEVSGHARAAKPETWLEVDASCDAVEVRSRSRDSEFDLISDARFASGKDGARSVGESNAKTIVFIDAGVADINTITKAASMDAEIVMLDAKSDGIGQIAGHLQGRAGIEKVHIVSNGEPGELHLGNATLSLHSIIGAHRNELATIKSALANDAGILVRGCDVSANAQGEAFVAALAGATGACVSCSDGPAGGSVLGGDRDLEISQRLIGAFINVVPDCTRFLAPADIGDDGPVPVTANGTSQGYRRTA